VAISAVRKIAAHAVRCGVISGEELAQIKCVGPGRVIPVRPYGTPTVSQVVRLLALPDRSSNWGKRDAAILSLVVGCGLTRAEMAALRWESCRSRNGRMYIDIAGECARLRSVPTPLWAQADMDTWYIVSRDPPPEAPYSLRHLERTRPRNMDYVAGGMSGDGIHDLVRRYGRELGLDLTPSDLRRCFARMLFRAGASREYIQYVLGHQSRSTTDSYLNSDSDCRHSPPLSVRDLAVRDAADEAGTRRQYAERGKKRGSDIRTGWRSIRPLKGSVREYLLAGDVVYLCESDPPARGSDGNASISDVAPICCLAASSSGIQSR
jgi:integrase